MTTTKFKFDLPQYAIKHIEKIKILFVVNSQTNQTEAFVPLSEFLTLLDKSERLRISKQLKK